MMVRFLFVLIKEKSYIASQMESTKCFFNALLKKDFILRI